MFYSFSLQGFGQYNCLDKTRYCLLVLFYEENLSVHMKAKCISCDFSKQSIMSSCWLKAVVSDFLKAYRWLSAIMNIVGVNS